MYQQPNHSYTSTESLRRMSSNNPFRNISTGTNGTSDSGNRISSTSSTGSGSSIVKSPPSKSFESWVQKNKQLIEEDDSIDDHYDNYLLLDSAMQPPVKPRNERANSDSSIRMLLNNPFASALNNGYVHHREPPPIPATRDARQKSSTPPARPAKGTLPPPSYEEAAGPEAVRKEYPREKSSSRSSRPHRTQSERRPGDRSHRHRSDREHRSDHKDRDRHHKSSKRSPSKKTVEPVKSKNLDTIDKLDVTGFFGGGFHHDGPFDACTPHRNKNKQNAPVMAFPADGPNSSIKGSKAYDPNEQMNLAFGNYGDQNEIVGKTYEVPYTKTNKRTEDMSSSLYTPKENPSVVNFDAYVKSEPVHGIQTAGLGSTTFIDGAPAPKTDDNLNLNNGGLGRKKSLVQRLRKNSSDYNTYKNRSNDELNVAHSYDSNEGNSLIRRVKSLKVGRRER